MIELQRVSVAYADGGRPAVREASLSISAGDFVALVGPSGSGKTSLLKTINRLIEPSGGTIRVEDRDVADFAAHELRRRIGYVFQGVGLFPHMSVRENIAITPSLLGWDREKIAARVDDVFDLIALPRDYLDRAPSALSGGERQRVAVARALAAEPRIVIMDEPFGALDPVTRDALGRAYRALHERMGLTTVMVTHDVQEAALLADRIVALRDGCIVADDTPRAMLSGAHPEVSDMFETPRRQAAAIADLAR
ncbi:MAG: ATP-binding cassette domain-containing protein [Methylobacteriaceae bacterium]|nr:ATP-binding cassette domain-containing protein [Methylobacteriaceae bacterium]